MPKASKDGSNAKKKGLLWRKSCQVGNLDKCGPIVLLEHRKRLEELGCDHDAVFALSYLYTTETILSSAEDAGFEDINSVVREVALFSDYYFQALDSYHRGEYNEVPPVWKFTFDASKFKSLTSSGNQALGSISHLLSDLPFILYDLYNFGTPISETDHNAVNSMFTRMEKDAAKVIQQFYDETYPDSDNSEDGLTLVLEWRAQAWRDYQQLVLAKGNLTEIENIVNGIEEYALQTAQSFATFFQTSANASDERDVYCKLNLVVEKIP